MLIFQNSFGINLIRDAEIETVLTEMVKPIFKVAGLKEKSAKVFVVNSDEINAFTIGNGYIFVNSGLLLKFNNPTQIIAILSHETAHIAAGHINRLMVRILNRQRNATGAMLAGLLATILTGSEKAMAASLGYLMADERLFLRYSRGEELAADNLGASYMEKLGYDIESLISVFQTFREEGLLNGGEFIPEYIKSHPDADSRIAALKNRSHGSILRLKADKVLVNKYSRILRKLKAFLKSQNLPEDEYSKAIYLQHYGKISESIDIIEKLSAKNPHDIFYKEMLAQLFYESGSLKKSIEIYQQVYRHDLHYLIKKDYAEILIEANNNLDQAIRILESVKYDLCFDSDVFRLLAIAYGKKNKIGISNFMLAQEKMMQRNFFAATKLLDICLSQLDIKTENSYINKAKYLKELINRNQR